MSLAKLLKRYERLSKVLGLLGSKHAGERDAAALQAERIRGEIGMTWEHLLIGTAQALIDANERADTAEKVLGAARGRIAALEAALTSAQAAASAQSADSEQELDAEGAIEELLAGGELRDGAPEFLASLRTQLRSRGGLSPKQRDALNRMYYAVRRDRAHGRKRPELRG